MAERETVLCGRSAYAWWQMPPLVRALAAVDAVDDAALPVAPARLWDAQVENARSRDIWRQALLSGQVGRPLSSVDAVALLASLDRLSPGLSAPVDVLVGSPAERRPSAFVRPHVWSGELPDGCVCPVGNGLAVTSPAFTLLMLAGTLSLPCLVMAASELCGTFAVFPVPEGLRRLIEELHAEGALLRMGAWTPAFDREGRLSEVWSRPAPTTPDELLRLAGDLPRVRGRRRLAEAARLVRPAAASPFEVRAGMLLGWETCRGGEGYGGLSHNRRVALTAPAQRLARRQSCFCDLFWPAGEGRRALDVECQSGLHHADEQSYLSDADRASALQLMDVDVVGVTYGQLADEGRFDALSALVAERLGTEPPTHTPEFLARRRALRAEVLTSWDHLLA